MLPVSRVPVSSYSASSYSASAMPWATPPITWPSTTNGLMMVPQSSTATYFLIRVEPVSGSTSTTQMLVPDGKVQLGGSNTALASSNGSTPAGMLWAVQAEKASSGTVLARSGAPLTWNLPSVHSRSSSATSSSWAASTLAFSRTRSAAFWMATPPADRLRLP